jgi:hypothetical protein
MADAAGCVTPPGPSTATGATAVLGWFGPSTGVGGGASDRVVVLSCRGFCSSSMAACRASSIDRALTWNAHSGSALGLPFSPQDGPA